jgi:hypothetical protein
MKKTISLVLLTSVVALQMNAQLYINSGTTFYIQSGGVVTVQGDVISNVDIQGPGKVLLKGSSNQNVNMNGFSVLNLEMDNTANATLTGNARIGTSILFTNGKIQQGNFNVTLADVATNTGGGASKFFETNGTGQLLKNVSSNTANYEMPLGIGTTYLPAFVQTNGTYASAAVGVQVKDAVTTAYAKRHPRSTDYSNEYWPITQTGVTGTLRVKGQYNATYTGIETDMRGFYHNGTDWSTTNANIDYTQDTAGSLISGNGELYAMNRFVLANPKAYLQGALDFSTGLMTDVYRSIDVIQTPGTPSATNVIPTNDPYRNAPYTSTFLGASNPLFSHINNASAETVNATVFDHKVNTNDHIVDWVYLELRNTASPGNIVLQTRSALIQRDGDIVDIDGVSPIYFKNIDPTNYILAIRHRNHLGVSIAPTSPISLSTTSTNIDFTNSTIFGTASNNYLLATVNGVPNKIVLLSGNTNGNEGDLINSRYNFSSNDRDYILNNLLSGNRNNTTININSVSDYTNKAIGDLNFNRQVRYNFSNNDVDFLLNTVLNGNRNTTTKFQNLPN